MIAKSDLVILTLSTAALVVGIYRWQHTTTVVPSLTVQASSREGISTLPPPGTTLAARLPAEASADAVPDAAPVVRRLPTDARPEGAESVATAIAPTTLEASPAPVSVEARSDAGYGTYRVRSGDYLGRIARRFATSVATLRELNGIDGSTIQVGQTIRYPLP